MDRSSIPFLAQGSSVSTKWTYIVTLAVVSIIGIASRVFYIGSPLWDKYVGDVVYAVFFYLVLGIVWDGMSPGKKAILTLVFVLVVEVFQLTLIPLQFSLSDNFLLQFASILLGTQFAWWDILAYSVGIVGVYFADRAWQGRELDRYRQLVR
jgi:hypothetical protein